MFLLDSLSVSLSFLERFWEYAPPWSTLDRRPTPSLCVSHSLIERFWEYVPPWSTHDDISLSLSVTLSLSVSPPKNHHPILGSLLESWWEYALSWLNGGDVSPSLFLSKSLSLLPRESPHPPVAHDGDDLSFSLPLSLSMSPTLSKVDVVLPGA